MQLLMIPSPSHPLMSFRMRSPSPSLLTSSSSCSCFCCSTRPSTLNVKPKPPQLQPLLVSESLALSLALALTLTSPCLPSLAIPFLNSPQSLTPTTPFSQSKDQPLGLLQDGKIRPCPSTNPGCVSTNPKSSSFAFPWRLPDSLSKDDAVQKLKEAILKTQSNAKVEASEDTPFGHYLRAEVDGGFGRRDVLEFLVRGDRAVAYRIMATKVTYVYPFTTALGDSKGQEERMKKIMDELGWYAPSFDAMD